jgi:Domain of unknown function (DUF4037)
MPEFIPGLKLSELFYQEAVRPIMDAHFPGQAHSAALVGYGSDVISFDTPLSRDHMWGPRLVLFLPETEFERLRAPVDDALRKNLPYTFRGYPTNFGAPDNESVRWLKEINSGPVDHLVEITTLAKYITGYLGINPYQEINLTDWLTFHEHRLLAMTSGGVFHDDLGLNAFRQKISYYPRDIWLYLLAAEWGKIDQEEPFMGRTGDTGDEIGSRIIAARLVQYMMHLGFLIERRYRPYSKWFGSAFLRLESAKKLSPIFGQILAAADWKERQHYLSQAYRIAAEMHNALHITPALEVEISSFHERPYLVLHSGRFVDALLNAIQDEAVRALPPRVGSINQFVDSTDVDDNVQLCQRLKEIYQ